MANAFLDVRDILAAADDPLNYINYDSLVEEHKEFLLSNNWDLQWIEAPHAVYFPGNDLHRLRNTAVSPAFTAGLTEVTAILRTFTVRQTVHSGTSSGTVTCDYIDREDRAIAAFVFDWYEKMGGHNDRYQFRKEDTIGVLKLTHFNTSRKPIAEFIMYAVQLNSGQEDVINKAYNSDDPANNGEYSITYSFEHYNYQWLNVD